MKHSCEHSKTLLAHYRNLCVGEDVARRKPRRGAEYTGDWRYKGAQRGSCAHSLTRLLFHVAPVIDQNTCAVQTGRRASRAVQGRGFQMWTFNPPGLKLYRSSTMQTGKFSMTEQRFKVAQLVFIRMINVTKWGFPYAYVNVGYILLCVLSFTDTLLRHT